MNTNSSLKKNEEINISLLLNILSSIYKSWFSVYVFYLSTSGVMFFLIPLVLSLNKYRLKITENKKFKKMILAVNSFLTINWLVLILSLIAMLCLIMYPTNMSLYYKNKQCNNELSKKQISNCIDIISIFFNHS